MNTLADMAIDLLCQLSFVPDGGHDPEDVAATEQRWWQILIHDLSPEEHLQVINAIRSRVDEFQSSRLAFIPEHLKRQLETLQAYIAGEIN
jgi:hypothetical protein